MTQTSRGTQDPAWAYAGIDKMTAEEMRERAAGIIGCSIEEVDDDPRLAEITGIIYQENGVVRLGPLTFCLTELHGKIGVFLDDTDVPLGTGDTASDALTDALRRTPPMPPPLFRSDETKLRALKSIQEYSQRFFPKRTAFMHSEEGKKARLDAEALVEQRYRAWIETTRAQP